MNPNTHYQRKGAIALMIFLALAFGTASGFLIASGLDWIPHTIAQGQPQGETVQPSQFLLSTQESFRQLVGAVRPAVVSIQAIGVQMEGQSGPMGGGGGPDPFEQFFNFPGNPFGMPNGQGQPQPRQRQPQTVAAGSGFIVDPSGYILTNNHVVEGATDVEVKTDDGRQFKATVVGTDPETDVAVLKIQDSANFPYVAIGDSDKLEVGDWVMAIGNPFGNLAGTVTVGIVSARNREGLQLPGNTVYQDFIQTDAAINLGNSGGPLVDVYGKAVGINTAITAQGSGIGFAIPINLAKFVYDNIRSHGSVVRSWIGVTIQNLDEDLAKNLGLPDNRGALVAEVRVGDPADKAGLKAGDVILDVKGTRVTSSQSASRTIASLKVGEPSDFRIWRDGQEQTITITPSQRDEKVASANPKPGTQGGGGPAAPTSKSYLGLEVQELSDNDRQQANIPDTVTGVVVMSVEQNSTAYDKGLRAGMIITSINHQTVNNVGDYDRLMADAESTWQSSHKTVLMRVAIQDQNGWVTQFLAIPFE